MFGTRAFLEERKQKENRKKGSVPFAQRLSRQAVRALRG